MHDSYSYKAFISQSHTDQKWARWLHRALESYRIPKHLVGTDTGIGPIPARLTPVFRDRDELAVSADLSDRIREALMASEFLGETLFNRSQAEFWVGFVHWRSGSLTDARQWLAQYRDGALELFALDPSRDDWLQEVAYGHHNLAVLDHDSGDLESAIAL